MGGHLVSYFCSLGKAKNVPIFLSSFIDEHPPELMNIDERTLLSTMCSIQVSRKNHFRFALGGSQRQFPYRVSSYAKVSYYLLRYIPLGTTAHPDPPSYPISSTTALGPLWTFKHGLEITAPLALVTALSFPAGVFP